MLHELLSSLLSLAYVHDFSPFAIRFGESFGIRWYGLAYLAGFIAAYWLIRYFAQAGRSPLTVAQISDYVFALAVGTLIGGRLGFCLFYNPSLFTTFSSSFPFWGVLEVHKGGMASHGGIIGIIVACWYVSRKEKLPLRHLFDLVAVTGPLGIFFGRLANFVNGELYGRETTSSLAVKFPREIQDWSQEKLLTLTPVVGKLGVTANDWTREVLAGSYRAMQTIELILEKIQTKDTLIKLTIEPLLTPRYPSQLFEAFAEGIGLFGILLVIFLTVRRAGAASAGFLILYPVARIICEQYRLPDAGIGFQLWGLTRGQWLSIAMLLLAAVFLLFSKKHDSGPGTQNG